MFRPLTVEHIVQRYIKFLDYFAKNPDSNLKDQQQTVQEKPGRCSTIPARRANGVPGGDTRVAGRRRHNNIQNENGCILIDKFERQVLETPGNIAVKVMQKTYTYRDLNRTANRIARQILKTAPGKTVGLFFQQGIDMIAAILGTLKAGKIYVPLSVEYPVKRLDYMLMDSGAALLLTNSPNEPAARQLARSIPLLNIDEIGDGTTKPQLVPGMDLQREYHWKPEDDINPHREAGAGKDNIAYILYTSGSTGRPKGVAQTHANADYYTRNWIRKFSITSADRMTLFSSFCHDGSVQDMFSALYTGAALYPYNMKDRDLTVELTQMLIEEKITIWHSVPSLFSYFTNCLPGNSMLRQLSDNLHRDVSMIKNGSGQATPVLDRLPGNSLHNVVLNDTKADSILKKRTDIIEPVRDGLTRGETFPQLRLILLGGEAVRRHEVEMLKKHYPKSKMANVYGQTESSVNAIGLMDQFYHYQKTLIGDPLEETQIIIAGETGNRLDTLEVGEILVASRYIAPGYWQRPEATAKAFIQHETYGKVYRTGDLGRQLADGTIEILGRRDSQVKIRGYRVEPGEIESNILAHTEISESVIIMRENNEGEKYLCAYYVAPRKIEPGQLRNFLLETLPDYMIPLHFTRLEKIPLTPGGKTDRNVLPEPAALHAQQH
ncbi:MAG: amino acid adenylation domain-containing protein, partial [bacterium]|nr:amino acid adenylation domain-containing protein [bacterium]